MIDSAEQHHAETATNPAPMAAGLRPVLRAPRWFLGLLLLTAVENSLLTGAFWEGAAAPFKLTGSIYALCSAISFLVAAALSKKGSVPLSLLRLYRTATSALALGILSLAAVQALPASPLALGLSTAASAVIAVSYAPLVLAWMGLFARQPIARTFICFALAYAGGCIASLAAVLLSPKWLVELLMALGVAVSAGLFRQCQGDLPDPGPQDDRTDAVAPFPLRPVIICGVVSFVTTFLQNCNPTASIPGAVFGGSVLTMAVLGVLALRRDTDLMGLQQVALVMAVAAALSIPFAGTALGDAGTALSLAANLVFLVFAETVLCGIGLRYGFNVPWLIGISLAVMSAASLAAVGACIAFQAAALGQAETTLFAAALALSVLVLFLCFVTEADILGAWGMRDAGPATLKEEQPAVPDLQMRVFALSCRYGFTKREEEVCALLAQGANVAGIEEALVVSNSTAKTHVAHIYKKMGIHSIQEFHAAFTR